MSNQSAHSRAPTLLNHGTEMAERVRNLTPYEPVCSLTEIKRNAGISHLKLDWNESTIPPAPRVTEALLGFLHSNAGLNLYPDMCYAPLLESLAEYVGCRTSQLLLTNGSDAALDLICQTYLDPVDKVVHPTPTYSHMLQFAERTGAEIRGVTGENPFVPHLQDLVPAIDERTKIVYLASPNNPTGNVHAPADVLKMAQRHPNTLFILDEAYFEFSEVTCVELVDEIPNLVVTRSFSKCFGLAAVRRGYAVAPEEVIANLRRAHNPKSVNMLAQVAATAALKDLPYYRRFASEVKRSAALFKGFCDQRGIPCHPTQANFVLVQFPDVPDMARRLAEAGVYVRDRSDQMPGVLRITLGTKSQTMEMLARLDRILAGKPSRSQGTRP